MNDLLGKGLDLMSFGMGTVFVFLTILVIATTLMSRTVTRFFPETLESEVAPQPVASNAPVDPKMLKVIQAAVDLHRGRNN